MIDSELRLATWIELHAHLARSFPQLGAAESEQLELAIADTTIVVRRLPGDWIELAATVGPSRGASTAHVLRDNLRMLIGALAIQEGEMTLRQLLPLDLRAIDLDETIGALAQQCAAHRG